MLCMFVWQQVVCVAGVCGVPPPPNMHRAPTHRALACCLLLGGAAGTFYTLTTGANERRWGKMKDKLQTTVRSFSLIN